jgi:hypothetical protein
MRKWLVPIPALCAVLAVPWAFPAPLLKLNMVWERWSAGLEEPAEHYLQLLGAKRPAR